MHIFYAYPFKLLRVLVPAALKDNSESKNNALEKGRQQTFMLSHSGRHKKLFVAVDIC